MALPEQCEIVVVGGGLAGLAAARRLDRAGRDWILVEAADHLGGRVSTDHVDGYTLDRGFQVLNTAYPRLAPLLDLDALDLQFFAQGVLVRRAGRLHRLDHPLRDPAGVPRTLAADVGTLTDRLRFAALATRCATYPAARLLAAPEVTAQAALRQAGLSHRIIEEALRPFLSGVFADRALDTSSHVLAMILRSFALGRIGVPARGMAALPAAIAAPLPASRLHVGHPVRAIAPGRVKLENHEVRALAVLVATDAPAAATLLPTLPRPTMNALTTYYHSAPTPPVGEPILLLDGDRRERVANTVMLPPAYAPAGHSLIATTVVGPSAPPEPTIRTELAHLYGRSVADWESLSVVSLPHALPAAPPPQARLRKPVTLTDGLYVAGDHRDSPSIQGALASGWRAAGAILAALRVRTS